MRSRSTGELLGLVAYLSVMYGRLPDREMIAAAVLGAPEHESGRRRRARLGGLAVVTPSPARAEPAGASNTTAA